MKQEKYDFLQSIIEERVGNDRWFIDLEHGRIFTKKGREIGTNLHNSGYLRIGILGKTYFTHELVALAGGLNPTNLTINHIDGCKTNNQLNNLEVLSHAENIQHAVATGLFRKKERLTEETVRVLKKLMNEGITKAEISRKFDISTAQLRHIDKGRTHKEVCI